MIKPERLNELIDKAIRGTATEQEKQELDEWYLKEAGKEHIWYAESADEESVIRKRILEKVNAHIYSPEIKTTSSSHPFSRLGIVAASVLLIATIAIYRYIRPEEKQMGRVQVESVQLENRFILLPDSSKVILRPGADLVYEFTSECRKVTLTGGAYFDVTSDSLRPFLVHSGDVMSKVLGTSFSIEAYSEQNVTVSVHTGKVSVADKKKQLLAVLSPNEQLQYTLADIRIEITKTPIKTHHSWLNYDMQFKEISLEKVIESLSRRYNVKIELDNPKMKECLITGSFEGVEPLTDVLKVLSITTGATYRKKGDKIILKGKGCMGI